MSKYVDEFISRFSVEGASKTAAAMRAQGPGAASAQRGMNGVMQAAMGLAPQITGLADQLSGMSQTWATAYRDAELVNVRLESLGKQQGMSPEAIQSLKDMSAALMGQTGFDDEAIMQSAVNMMNFGMSADQVKAVLPLLARQARTLGQDIGSMGMAMGKGFGTGNLGAMKRMGITIDDVSFAQWQAMSKTTDWNNAASVAALRTKVLDGAMKGMEATAMPLDAIMESSAARAELYAAKVGNVQESLGKGAQKVNEYRNSLTGMLLDLAEANPVLTEFAGSVSAAGAPLMKGAGTVLGMGRSLVEMAMYASNAKASKLALAAATKTDTAAEIAKTGVAGKEGAALLKGADAAKTAAAAKLGLGKITLGNAGGLFGLGGTGLLGANAGAALGGGLGAGAALGAGGLIAGTAAAGWGIGSSIAVAGNIGGARDLRDARRQQRELEQEMGGRMGDAITPEMIARARSRRGLTGRQQPGGDITFRLSGNDVLTDQEMQDWALSR